MPQLVSEKTQFNNGNGVGDLVARHPHAPVPVAPSPLLGLVSSERAFRSSTDKDHILSFERKTSGFYSEDASANRPS